MGLNPQDRIGRAISRSIRAIFRVVIVKRVVESGQAFLQAFARGDPDDPTNQELMQEADLDHIQHFGFESFPPIDGNTEAIVVDADGGEAAIAEKRVLPSGLPALLVNEARIYGEDGQYVNMKSGGNVVLEPKAGSFILLGSGATDWAVKASLIDAELQAIQIALNTHIHSGVQPGVGVTGASAAGYVPGSVNATKVKVE
jgi:phage gp45-like